ncbi:hypothetical protein [Roseicella aquatilis]|uniref:Uncharacterized protein n=1 Tax=Roseicella aquatilis TaxID=2527868 RepID=A0A4R4DED2_9PROT|nr:hypothetical protein [Roseicella aquatilis]TCZ58725.1 hypothetical protein EXY23_16055 [Roseicella aquatilis]
MTTTLYQALKGSAHFFACEATGSDDRIAAKEGRRDVYDLLLADTDADSVPVFLSLLMDAIPCQDQRRLLLDGLAREYAGVPGWTSYAERTPVARH